MKILLVSDTHGEDEHLEEVLAKEAPIDLLIHCGDVEGRDDYIEVVAECETYFVAGNNDFYSTLPRELVLTLGKHRVLVTHGHGYSVSWDLENLVSAALSRDCTVALFGHIHVPVDLEIDGVRCLNPGSLTYPRQKGKKAKLYDPYCG